MELELLFDFIKKAKCARHTVSAIAEILKLNGYTELFEGDHWELSPEEKYFVIRGGSSIIAFRNHGFGYMICASHSDQPAFMVKCDEVGAPYTRLLTEKYGGMLYYSWLDRPLAIVGSASVVSDGGVEIRNLTLDRRVVIPSVAIHLNRSVNDKLSLNPAKDMIALSGLADNQAELKSIVAKTLGCDASDIISYELYLASDEEPRCIGFNNELILSPRLDDLACVYASLMGFLNAESSDMTPIFAVFDNEEVGSETKQGAASTFLCDTLLRISGGEREYLMALANSFMISADNAHAVHPNSPELSDKSFAPKLGGGVVIKHNANQRYATGNLSEAVFVRSLMNYPIKLQHYYNRADIPGGSTLGSISDTRVSIPTVDIGIPQLAMHSICETAAVFDFYEMTKALMVLYSTSLKFRGDSIEVK